MELQPPPVEKSVSCMIDDILKIPFTTRQLSEKMAIVKRGRPKPPLENLTTKYQDKNRKKDFVRCFNVCLYEKNIWLTGSVKHQRLYCWPCLLFSTDRGVWNFTGFNNLNSITCGMQKHERSLTHIQSFLSLNSFDKPTVDLMLFEQHNQNIIHYNKIVRKNREVLKKLIDVICFMNFHELPAQGYVEGGFSKTKSNYSVMLNFLSDYDLFLKSNLECTPVFQGLSVDIQNDLVQAISDIIVSHIRYEVSRASFVSLILEETSNVMNCSIMSTTLRYVNHETGEVFERFLSFANVHCDRSVNGIMQHVTKTIEEFDVKKKLVAQTFDGAVVRAGDVGDLKTKIQELCPSALFVYNCSHNLNKVLAQSCYGIMECHKFFMSLNGLGEFISKSSKQKEGLNRFLTKALPNNLKKKLNFSSCLVQTVAEYRVEFLNYILTILENSIEWDQETIIKAQGFAKFLEDFNSHFFLKVYSLIFSQTYLLFCLISTEIYDMEKFVKRLSEIKDKLMEKKGGFEKIWKEMEELKCKSEPEVKRKRSFLNPKENYEILYFKIFDGIINQLEVRFDYFSKFEFVSLLDYNRYCNFKKDFPVSAIHCLAKHFAKHFNFCRLKNELTVFYSREEFYEKDPYQLLKYMLNSNIHVGMTEVFKLALLINTLPSTTIATKKYFSVSKRIKSYQKETQDRDMLPPGALLLIEKSLLKTLKKKDIFYEEVIENFCGIKRRPEFIYK